jgi:signal transduction histidine kinase
LDAVAAAAGMALENGQLQAELKARLEELEGSRARVIEAGRAERKRLERNLHDGTQQRLIVVSMELAALERRLDDPDARARVQRARGEVTASLGELREVASGLYPAVLSLHGLPAALTSLARRAAVPVKVELRLDTRLPEAIEVVVYYVVSESLANIGKHAHATSATVAVALDAGYVSMEINDDGVGGADLNRGSGLRGLADRLDSVGGELRVDASPAGGTRVRAIMPADVVAATAT